MRNRMKGKEITNPTLISLGFGLFDYPYKIIKVRNRFIIYIHYLS